MTADHGAGSFRAVVSEELRWAPTTRPHLVTLRCIEDERAVFWCHDCGAEDDAPLDYFRSWRALPPTDGSVSP